MALLLIPSWAQANNDEQRETENEINTQNTANMNEIKEVREKGMCGLGQQMRYSQWQSNSKYRFEFDTEIYSPQIAFKIQV